MQNHERHGVNTEKMEDGSNALDRACYSGNKKIIKLFFASGVNYYDESLCSVLGLFENSPEYNEYTNNPVTYVLKNNQVAKIALNALNNIKIFLNDEMQNNLLENVIQCLKFYIGDCEKKLETICEDKNSYQCLSTQLEACKTFDLNDLCGDSALYHIDL